MPDIATQMISLGSLTALVFVMVVAAIRYFPGLFGFYSSDKVDRREHQQKSNLWLQQEKYRVLILLLMAVIKQAGNDNINMMVIFKMLINDDLNEDDIEDLIKKDAT